MHLSMRVSMKWIIFVALVLSNAYVCIELTKTRHELAYEKVQSERAIREINLEWVNNQNTIDRQHRLIEELSKKCGQQ